MLAPEVIVIGAGPSGIALAHSLKCKLGFDDFTVSVVTMGAARIGTELGSRSMTRRMALEAHGEQIPILACRYKTTWLLYTLLGETDRG